MAQHIADLVEGRSLAQHRHCQGVTEQMDAVTMLRTSEPGRRQRIAEHLRDNGSGPERAPRRPGGDEQVTTGSFSAVADVVDERFPDVDREWHGVVTIALAPNQDLAGAPANIFKADGDHFLRTKSQPAGQQQNRVVAASKS